MSDDGKYPDLVVPDSPEGFKALHPALNGKRQAPMIAWGPEYAAWPADRKINYLEKLASSMNHAADVMQKERNRALARIAALDKRLAATGAREIRILHDRFQDFNASRQSLFAKIVTLEATIARQTKQLKELVDGALD